MSCIVTLSDRITGEDSGGTWTRISGTGGIFNAGAGTFDPTGGSVGNHVFRYTVGTGSCSSFTDITIPVVEGADAGNDGNVSMCTGDPSLGYAIQGGADTNGTFSGTIPNGVIVSYQPTVPGFVINPNGIYTGTFNVTYTVQAANNPDCDNCTDSSTHTVTITDTPNSGQPTATITVCN